MEFIRIHDCSLQIHTSFFQLLLPALPAMHKRTKMIIKCRTSNIRVHKWTCPIKLHMFTTTTLHNVTTRVCSPAFVYLPLFTCLCLPAFVYLPLFTCHVRVHAMAMCPRQNARRSHNTLHVGVHSLNGGYIIMVFLTTLEIIYSNVLRNVVTLNSCDLMDKF